MIETKDVKLHDLGFIGDNVPELYYISERFGHVNYLLRRCKEEGISATSVSDYVMIYAKSKAEQFKRLVVESFRYDNVQPPRIKGNSATYRLGDAIVCVIVGTETCVTEGHVPDLIEFIFKKQIPHTEIFRIFGSQKEMKDYLESTHRIVI